MSLDVDCVKAWKINKEFYTEGRVLMNEKDWFQCGRENFCLFFRSIIAVNTSLQLLQSQEKKN